MSIKLMALVWERDMEPTRKLLLLKLADYANDDGSNVFPSKKTLARKTGISERTVQRILGEFREQGVLEVDVEANFHRPNQYHLNTHLLRGDTVTPPPARGDTGDSKGRQMMHLRGDTVTPKLKTEPSENHQRKLGLLKAKELKNQLRAGKLGRVS